jgi:hypothetical protein
MVGVLDFESPTIRCQPIESLKSSARRSPDDPKLDDQDSLFSAHVPVGSVHQIPEAVPLKIFVRANRGIVHASLEWKPASKCRGIGFAHPSDLVLVGFQNIDQLSVRRISRRKP